MTELAKEYATGLYELAQEEKLTDEMLDQMQTLQGCLHDQPDFFRLLDNRSISKQERLSILDQTLRSEVHPYLLNFMKILCERGALGEFGGCVKAFHEQYDADHGVLEATVTTSAELSDSQRKRLSEKLSAMTGRQVRLREKIDVSVIDGVLLEMDGRRYDNTLRQRLKSIRDAMAAEG